MKLSKEKSPEFKKLSEHFLKIETLATKMGIDVDDLMNEYKNNGAAVYSTFKEKLLSKAGERATTFKNAKSDPSEEAPVGREII